MNSTSLAILPPIRNLLMKNFTLACLLLISSVVVFTGCGAATELAEKGAEMANVDFGDFDFGGLKEKLAGVTDGFKDVNAENVDGLTSNIEGVTESIEGMGELGAGAKTAVGGVLTPFIETVKSALGGISDDGIMGKIKPAVDALSEKIAAFKG